MPFSSTFSCGSLAELDEKKMRDEDEVQAMADSASSAINTNPALGGTVKHKGHVYDLDYLRGVRECA
jgi:hypothetical protein